ncbi:hypothetical protein [Fortiea contorta]|uniref:hypothetical protein n=1 Tax=Fortiea contorta TaxID=1892405 RepID=UPI000346B0CB
MLPVVRSQRGFVSGGLLEYFKRRSRRILPPYYATLFGCLLLAFAIFLLEKFTDFQWNDIAGEGPFSPYFSFIDVLSHLLLIHNFSSSTHMTINPPMWSVATGGSYIFYQTEYIRQEPEFSINSMRVADEYWFKTEWNSGRKKAKTFSSFKLHPCLEKFRAPIPGAPTFRFMGRVF